MHERNLLAELPVHELNPYVSSIAVNDYVGELWTTLNLSLPHFNRHMTTPRTIRQYVGKILDENHIYDRIFSEGPVFVLPTQRVTSRVHEIVTGYLRGTKIEEFRERCEKLDILFVPYSKYFDGLDRVESIVHRPGAAKKAWVKMCRDANIDDLRHLEDYARFAQFLVVNIEKVADEGRMRTAIENSKIIAMEISSYILSEARCRWLCAFTCALGAVLASSIEDHRSVGWFLRETEKLINFTDRILFVDSCYLYIKFLKYKHFLDVDDEAYPSDNPAISAYLLIKEAGDAPYNTPVWYQSAVLRAATVELRHKGYAIENPPHEWKSILSDLEGAGNNPPYAEAKSIDHHIMVLLSHGWNSMRRMDLQTVEDITKKAYKLVREHGREYVKKEVDHLAGSLWSKASQENSLQANLSTDILKTAARAFADKGALSRAKAIFDETKK